MRSGPRISLALGATLLVFGAGVTQVAADAVSDQQRRVEAIADQLDNLENEIGQLEEDHAGALDRLDELAGEIAESQARVDVQSAELTKLRGQLTDIAVDKFVAGGATGVTPLLVSAETIGDELQRGELSRVALDLGAGTTDEMLVLVDELTQATLKLEQRKAEQRSLIASLETRQVKGESLTADLEAAYASANAELGDLLVQEQLRRANDAIAAAQARQAQSQAQAVSAPAVRGGGAAATPVAVVAATGSGGGGAAAPAPAPTTPPVVNVPAPSSMSGIAVNAASGQLGVPYKFAAESPGVAFDCSGLTKYAWGKAGVYLPHQSSQQFAVTPHVPQDQVQPGDLVFYYAPIGHVAIYIGGGSMIHAPASGDVVKVSTVNWNKVVGVSRPG